MDKPLVGEELGGWEADSWQRPVSTAVLLCEADNVISGPEFSSHLSAAAAHCEVKVFKMSSKRVIF